MADAIAAHMARWPPEVDTNVIFTNAQGLLIQEHPFSAALEHRQAHRGDAGLGDTARSASLLR
ncbi:MAG: hypothetical protein KY454_07240, partial [Actinobacteria bacterium]|nr:hypothetical protein [Actinomycetota bacterium]